MAETEVGSWLPSTYKKYGAYSAYVVLSATVVFCAFLVAFIAGAGAAVVGVVFLLLTLYLVYRMIQYARRPYVRYVLTNRHAIVYNVVPTGGQSVLQSCDLGTCTVDVFNRRVVSFAQTTGSVVGGGSGSVGMVSATTRGESNQLGDVLFMVGGIPQVKFVSVKDPDGILAAATHIIRSLRGTA